MPKGCGRFLVRTDISGGPGGRWASGVSSSREGLLRVDDAGSDFVKAEAGKGAYCACQGPDRSTAKVNQVPL